MYKPKVAFICVHNSCRSQIAEALGKHLASDVFESYSAGTETKPQINQDAVRLMKRICQMPFLPCNERFDWGLEDPTGACDDVFIETIREIHKKIVELSHHLAGT